MSNQIETILSNTCNYLPCRKVGVVIKNAEENTADILSTDNESACCRYVTREVLLRNGTMGISFNPASKAYFSKCSLDEYSCFSS